MYFENKKLKKIFVLAIFLISLCLPVFVFSQSFGLGETASKSGYSTAPSNIYETIGRIVTVAFATIAFIFFALTVYAGLRWVTARGQENLIEKAKGTMESAIIGLIIVSLSYALASFIIGRLGFQSSPDESSTTTVENCRGYCSSVCAVGEKTDPNGSCVNTEFKCCIKETEQPK